MKVYQIKSFIGPEGLMETEVPVPEATGSQVLVKMNAAAINNRDVSIINNNYPRSPGKPNVIPFSDGCGEVVSVGPQVVEFKPGDSVLATFIQAWVYGKVKPDSGNFALGGTIDGVLAEYKIFSPDGLVKIPEGLEHSEAACFPCAGATAWNALIENGDLKAGETVLLLGTGGVSIFALQIAKMHGAKVIIISSSDEKLQRASAMGADHLINYKNYPDWDKQVLDYTNGRGVDHVVEVGGGGTMAKSLQSVAFGGHVHVIGAVTGKPTDIPPLILLAKSIHIHGIYVGSKQMLERMINAFAANRIKPVIEKVFAWNEAIDAYRQMQSQEHFGKIVVKIG